MDAAWIIAHLLVAGIFAAIAGDFVLIRRRRPTVSQRVWDVCGAHPAALVGGIIGAVMVEYYIWDYRLLAAVWPVAALHLFGTYKGEGMDSVSQSD